MEEDYVQFLFTKIVAEMKKEKFLNQKQMMVR
jgi:hypothetical protein